MKNLYLGKHLTLDAYCPNRRADLQDPALLYNLLERLPELVGMTSITPPYLRKWLSAPNPDWGWSCFILIAESHISIHTFPEQGKFCFDLFSCKEFDSQKILDHLKEIFKWEDCKIHVLER